MRVIAAIAGLVLAIALAISALHAYANATANQSGSNNGTASSQDATFLQVTQQYNLAEQTFGQIAQDRGQAAGITQLATTTINDHKNAQTKVASLASSLRVDLPTTLSSVQQAQADQLKSVASSSFDLTYAENQVAGHQQSIASTQQEISHGNNSDVVSYAKSFLSLEQSHLHEAQTQLNALSGGGSGSGGGNTSEGGSSSGGAGGAGEGGSGGGSSPTAVPAGTGGSAARAPAELRARLSSRSHAQAGPHEKSRPATDDAGAGPPMAIALPSVDVTALVVPVGVSHRNLQVPDNATQVGWWVSSAVAGARTGSVIIDGHVDTEHGGLGALYRMGIGDLRVGDRIMLTTMFDRQVSYLIYAQDLYPKAAGLPADVLSQSREPRLVLITCGGPFDFTSRNYEDNVVVYARPTSD